jgi:HK97 family phage portal protein
LWLFKTKSAPVPGSETKGELTDPTSESWGALTGLFSSSSSGVSVNAVSAMSCAPVNAAVNLIAGALGTLPVRMYRNGPTGRERVDDHPVLDLIDGLANSWQSAGKVRELATVDAILHGDGFVFVNKVGRNPVELIYMRRDKVAVEYDIDTSEPSYRIGAQVYGPDRVIHIQNLSLDGERGFGLLRSGRDAIGLMIALERTSARLQRNSARPGGILSFKSQLRPEAVKRIGESWRAAHGGDGNGGVAVVDNSGEYKPVTFTAVEGQHVEQMQFSVQQIARLTGVPTTLLQDLSKGNFANTEQQSLTFLQHGLLPWLSEWTDAYARTLLTKAERKQYSFDFDVDALLRADTQARAAAFASLRSSGVLTGNDCRRELNLPSRPDGDSLTSPYTTAGNDNQKPERDADAA